VTGYRAVLVSPHTLCTPRKTPDQKLNHLSRERSQAMLKSVSPRGGLDSCDRAARVVPIPRCTGFIHIFRAAPGRQAEGNFIALWTSWSVYRGSAEEKTCRSTSVWEEGGRIFAKQSQEVLCFQSTRNSEGRCPAGRCWHSRIPIGFIGAIVHHAAES